MLKIIFITAGILLSSQAWAATTKPSPKKPYFSTIEVENLRKADLACIITKTGIVMSDNLPDLVKDATKECIPENGKTISYLKKVMAESAKSSKYKPTAKDLQSVGNATREINANMAIMSIELCAGLEKRTPQECIKHVNGLNNTNIDLP